MKHHQAYALKIKRKIFWYFLFRGVFLYKFRVIYQDKYGNSHDDGSNYEWWPYASNYRVCARFKKTGITFFTYGIYGDLDEFDVLNFLNNYKICVKRIHDVKKRRGVL